MYEFNSRFAAPLTSWRVNTWIANETLHLEQRGEAGDKRTLLEPDDVLIPGPDNCKCQVRRLTEIIAALAQLQLGLER